MPSANSRAHESTDVALNSHPSSQLAAQLTCTHLYHWPGRFSIRADWLLLFARFAPAPLVGWGCDIAAHSLGADPVVKYVIPLYQNAGPEQADLEMCVCVCGGYACKLITAQVSCISKPRIWALSYCLAKGYAW